MNESVAIPIKKIKKVKQSSGAIWTKRLGLIVLIMIIFGLPASFAVAYNNRIYPNVTVAGIQVGGMTYEEAKSAIESKSKILAAQELRLSIDGKNVNPKLDELGIGFDIEKAITSAYSIGRQNGFKNRFRQTWNLLKSGFKVELSLTIDEQKLDFYIDNLNSTISVKPTNATLTVNDGAVLLVPAQNGYGFNKEKLKDAIQKAVDKGDLNRQISLELEKIEAEVQNEGTNSAAEISKKYLAAAPITVKYQDKTWIADAGEIGSWLNFTAFGSQLKVNADSANFIGKIAKDVEVAVIDREIEEGTGNVLVEGQDGKGIDTKILANHINEALEKGKPVNIDLPAFDIPRAEKTVNPHAQAGRYEGRYIDINLSEQKLYAFEGSNLVNSFLVSTGRRGYATPTGEFHIYGKNRYALMDGPDYYLPNVPYVSWFSGDYSIHGTYWHHNFGHVMSHGCVNAPTDQAEWIYNWADIGTPVYIHY